MKIMQNPEDLDIFEGDQPRVSELIEGANVNALVNMVMERANRSAEILHQLPIDMYQRAAYEVHLLAKSGKAPQGNAEVLWALVQHMQTTCALAERLIKADPRLRSQVEAISRETGVQLRDEEDDEDN